MNITNCTDFDTRTKKLLCFESSTINKNETTRNVRGKIKCNGIQCINNYKGIGVIFHDKQEIKLIKECIDCCLINFPTIIFEIIFEYVIMEIDMIIYKRIDIIRGGAGSVNKIDKYQNIELIKEEYKITNSGQGFTILYVKTNQECLYYRKKAEKYIEEKYSYIPEYAARNATYILEEYLKINMDERRGNDECNRYGEKINIKTVKNREEIKNFDPPIKLSKKYTTIKKEQYNGCVIINIKNTVETRKTMSAMLYIIYEIIGQNKEIWN